MGSQKPSQDRQSLMAEKRQVQVQMEVLKESIDGMRTGWMVLCQEAGARELRMRIVMPGKSARQVTWAMKQVYIRRLYHRGIQPQASRTRDGHLASLHPTGLVITLAPQAAFCRMHMEGLVEELLVRILGVLFTHSNHVQKMDRISSMCCIVPIG